MKILCGSVSLNVEEFYPDKNSSTNIFLFHGFTGSAKDWNKIIPSLLKNNYNVFAVDLIGHGESNSPSDVNYYSAGSIVSQLDEIINHYKGNKNVLLGYSMGGRAALSYASKFHNNLSGVILESTSAGIKKEKERKERRLSDGDLVNSIMSNTIESFVDHWMKLGIFRTQRRLPKDIYDEVRTNKLMSSKTGLANSLLGFGTGSMPPLFDSIKNLNTKTLLITGELDEKFTKINLSLVKLFPNAEHAVIKEAGHNIHLEKPDAFSDVIIKFLNKL